MRCCAFSSRSNLLSGGGSPLGKAGGAGDEDWGTADDDPAEDGGAGFQGSREAEGRRRDCWLRWHQASVPHVSLGLGEQRSWPPSPAVPRAPDKLFPPELPPPPPALFLLQHLAGRAINTGPISLHQSLASCRHRLTLLQPSPARCARGFPSCSLDP